ncbi:MAG: GMC family oxidoreductase [Rhodobacteraceae bacterium]|nr:GMC family oxidoreductase [Paracoccaceae bacterium]
MHDYLVIGGGSAGCVVAAELARREAGTVMVVEAGPSEHHPLVSIPFGLIWLLGSRRDWAYRSAPMHAVGGRTIAIPRGRMVGGSGAINSMVWFRGRRSDFDGWNVPGWAWSDVEPAFEAVEIHLKPSRMDDPHVLTKGLASMLGAKGQTIPTPEYESAGVVTNNVVRGRRNSAATAFLRPRTEVEVRTGCEVDALIWSGDRVSGVRLVDGGEIKAAKGVVLSSGSIGSPSILMRSGVGPQDHLSRLGIDARIEAPEVGENLHDHPGTGLHFEGSGTGYGLELAQWPAWAWAPFRYVLTRTGRLASPTVEGSAFFNARGDDAEPDVQSHFIPFYLDWQGRKYPLKSGYFADVCLCRPKSRGSLRLMSKEARAAPIIDLGLLRDDSDLETLTAGIERLRALLAKADFGPRRAVEAHPGPDVTGTALKDHIRGNAGTAYHPVGTLRLGGPVTARLRVDGTENLWVADASVMPQVTSANTNAPSMMIGWKAAEFIAEDAA